MDQNQKFTSFLGHRKIVSGLKEWNNVLTGHQKLNAQSHFKKVGLKFGPFKDEIADSSMFSGRYTHKFNVNLLWAIT